MRSVRSKIITLLLAAVITCAAMTGLVGLNHMHALEAQSSAQILNLQCQKQAEGLNGELGNIQTSVDVIAYYAMKRLSLTDILRYPDLCRGYMEDLKLYAQHEAESSGSAAAYYFRVRPDLETDSSGFFFIRKNGEDTFVPDEMTDLSACDPEDEDAAWYYRAVEDRAPVWLGPYRDRHTGLDIISYVSPVYKDGQLIGVVGMDFDFQSMKNTAADMRAYRTGFAALTDENGIVWQHPQIEEGGSYWETDISGEDRSGTFLNEDTGNELIGYRTAQGKQKLCYATLRNGMKLVLCAPEKEIFARRDREARELLLIVALLGAAYSLTGAVLASQITRPLRRLTEAAASIAEGNLDVTLPPAGRDEVGTLTETIAVTTRYLRQYLAEIHSRAFRDTLTGVRNRSAGVAKMDSLTEELQDGRREFGLAVLQLPDVKQINDRYGRTQGDLYIRAACSLICHVFAHSPVFRTGGEEFLVVLEGESLERRETLMKTLQERMRETWSCPDPWKRISIAAGMAVCLPEDSSADDVLRRADEAMRQSRGQMKDLRDFLKYGKM